MEKELNIAAILKDKPYNSKLYDVARDVNVFYGCQVGNDCEIHCDLEEGGFIPYHYNGTLIGFPKGMQILKPSKEMQDWSKFAWKKGDVLTDEERFVIFECFDNDEYTEFSAPFEYKDGTFRRDLGLFVNEFRKVSDDVAQEVIKNVEEHYGGKLNLETLEIEKPQFKDGDIVDVDYVEGATFICICKKVEKDFMYCHARVNSYNKDLYLKKAFLKVNLDNRNPRPATDSEKQQLFDALAKEGKAWDAEKKAIVDLLKPMDWCLMRDVGGYWKLCQFGFKDETATDQAPYNAIGGNWFNQCIPYNEQTKHLLGTTDNWEGGEA